MQVSHTTDHITHAVIGGKETINFGISNSAEFFNILSSTLYKDQKLAVVREVLCNAWDAHIEAGCTDRAVEVTLSESKMLVQDFGNGIHHDDIGIIYGTYGNSTKKNDGKQTGGFGLGCKAPFAYTDHFEVISTNAGVKTIYTMAKSSAQVGGTPGITTLAQMPSTQTGLSVSLNLRPGDSKHFKELIERIASNGDMNVKLNEKQIDGLNFDTGVANWRIQYENPLDTRHCVLVRYGNVIYPIDGVPDELKQSFAAVEHRLAKIKRGYSYARIIFQAPPHSIAVTPSRESLSMQEHTINTLRTLMDGFIAEVDGVFTTESYEVLSKRTKVLIGLKEVSKVLNRRAEMPGTLEVADTLPQYINTTAAYTQQVLYTNYPEGKEFRKIDVTQRVQKLVDAKLIDRGLASSYLKELNQDSRIVSNYSYAPHSWQSKRVYGKLLSKMLCAGVDTTKLMVYDSTDYLINYRDTPLISVSKSKPRSLLHGLPYLQNIIVITQSRANLQARVEALHGGPLVNYKSLQGYLVYLAGRKKEDLALVQKFFASTNMTVIDMTVLEEKEAPEARTTTVAKPKLKGLVALKEMAKGLGYDESNRILDPEFVVSFTKSERSSHGIDSLGRRATQFLKKRWGDKGGLATTGAQYASWKTKCKTANVYLEEKVIAFVIANPILKEFFASSVNCLLPYALTDWLSAITKNDRLAKLFGIKVSITEEQEEYFEVFKTIGPQATTQQGKDLWAEYQTLPMSPKLQSLITKLKTSTLLASLERYPMCSAMESKKNADKAIKLFLFALNN